MEIGGAPVITLERPALDRASRPVFTRAQVLPGRGMMTLQIQAHLPGQGVTDLLAAPPPQQPRPLPPPGQGVPDRLAAPPPEKAREILDGASGDFPGNSSYLLGGAILIPYANRIRGKLAPDGRTIEAALPGGPFH